MDPVIVLLVVIMVIVTLLLVVVGVQVIIILQELRITLKHVNHTMKNTDDVVAMIYRSFTNIGHSLTGIKSGLQVMDIFFNWLKEHKPDDHRLPNS